jgi:hypothetical protein
MLILIILLNAASLYCGFPVRLLPTLAASTSLVLSPQPQIHLSATPKSNILLLDIKNNHHDYLQATISPESKLAKIGLIQSFDRSGRDLINMFESYVKQLDIETISLVDSSRLTLYRNGTLKNNSILRSTVLNALKDTEGDPRSYYEGLGFKYVYSAEARQVRRGAEVFLGLTVADYRRYLAKEGCRNAALEDTDGSLKFTDVFREMHGDHEQREALVGLVDLLDFDDTSGEAACLLPGLHQVAKRRRMIKTI